LLIWSDYTTPVWQLQNFVRRTAVEQAETPLRTVYRTAPYAVALVLVIGAIGLFATVGDSMAGRVLTSAVLAAALLIPFSEARGGLRARIPVLAAVLSVLCVLGAELALDENAVAIFTAAGLGVAVAALGMSLRRIVRREPVTADKVCAALTAYLLIGFGFAMGFGLTNALADDPFFAQDVEAAPSDFMYFSLITLTTVGYGDMTARAEETRLMAAIEAVTGQLFLVSVVAILVGRLVAAKPLGGSDSPGLFDDPAPAVSQQTGLSAPATDAAVGRAGSRASPLDSREAPGH
jgi:hypothetical protein